MEPINIENNNTESDIVITKEKIKFIEDMKEDGITLLTTPAAGGNIYRLSQDRRRRAGMRVKKHLTWSLDGGKIQRLSREAADVTDEYNVQKVEKTS